MRKFVNLCIRSVFDNLQRMVIDRGIFLYFTPNGSTDFEKTIFATRNDSDLIIHTKGLCKGNPIRKWYIPLENVHVMYRSKLELKDKNDLLIGTLECVGADFYKVSLGDVAQ